MGMHEQKVCCVCQLQFDPHPRVKKRQKTCGAVLCRKELQRRSSKAWRERHPDYFKGRYEVTLKEWYEKNGEYRKRYRQEHPEYVKKNALYVKAHRDKKA